MGVKSGAWMIDTGGNGDGVLTEKHLSRHCGKQQVSPTEEKSMATAMSYSFVSQRLYLAATATTDLAFVEKNDYHARSPNIHQACGFWRGGHLVTLQFSTNARSV